MTDQIKERKIKKRTIQEYERRSKLKLRSKCNVQNKMIINLWVAAVIRYKIRIIIKWRDEGIGNIKQISAANKYYCSARHHEQKNRKSTGQVRFSAVTIKQRIKLVLRHSLCK